MEANDGEACRVVYYCSSGHVDIAELFHTSRRPTAYDGSLHRSESRVYQNVHKLLDEDLGNLQTVFVSTNHEECLRRLHTFASSSPTAVLVEFVDSKSKDNAVLFLQELAANISSKTYPQKVMPFVLLATDTSTDSTQLLDASLESSYLASGALDTMRSPLCAEAVHQLIGHIKDTNRAPATSLAAGMAQNLVRHITNSTNPAVASHRPDEILSIQRRKTVEEAVVQWHFPAHQFDMDELAYAALVMLEHVLQNPGLEPYRLPRPQLMTFILAARREYKHEREVFYHNWRHAVDVTQSLYVFLCDVRLCPAASRTLPQSKTHMEPNAVESLLTPTEALILLVSAVGHDVGHPGVNNAFLVASNHQLAHLYNDKSVLENYHCAAYSQLLRRHWPQLNGIAQFRNNMISTILATDMQRHFEYMGYLSDLKQKMEGSDAGSWSDKDRAHAKELVMALLLKAADISNVARPFEVSAQWASILMHEFARQGELESELEVPTCLFGGPPDEKDLLAAAQSQKGFMNLFGFPLFKGISEVMPNVSCTLVELEHNKEVWEKRILEETARREASGSARRASKTYGSVTDSQVEEARIRKRESEPSFIPIEVPQTPTSPLRRQPGIDVGHTGTPIRHPASEHRQQLSLGPSVAEEKRASTPVLWPSALQLSPTSGESRRSSKDVALNHMHELSTYAQQNIAASGSRRGSADAGWQLHQNYPSSRRGSKEESLTTILVTSQGSPATRSSPSSSQTRVSKPASPARSSGLSKRASLKQSTTQASGGTRHPAPSTRSQTTTSVAATTDPQSPSTQPSSLAPTEDDNTRSGIQHSAFSTAPAATDGFPTARSSLPGGLDGAHQSSVLPDTPPAEAVTQSMKSDSPVVSRVVSGDSGISRLEARKTEPHIRESRSRSRLRSLKFWKRRRDVPGTDGHASSDYSP
ncbi:Putative HD/PDEase domain, 3'5'-cyclic nucleotide phosphodiesterase [Septoria linicola]|uniref:Phosphodiesterase n=1 Tax=Septoria linicola TaxID=215465 RepID=A0A9Q9ED21_9PEZI|nr:Putative HD/PDEase domain, 3'5'-cyclic nucleotide phosphodiesterase [Septoria linicola]